ncbi:MAG: phosphate ABC transporter permease subunit PstC [Rhodospirillales bacterium]|nr:phosphate ABC transporter permease subunit PstC [Rhodospirillales bacterium]MBO6788403.1 phosphate ABC transporter permease subunit PstC [Rhodospirillales bacterium]
MSFTFVLGALIILTVAGFYMGRSRSLADAGGTAQRLHSRPHYYGYFVALWCGIPTLLILGVWTMFQTPIIEMLVQNSLPETMLNGDPAEMSLIMNDIRNLASGNITSGEITPQIQAAADHYVSLNTTSSLAKFVVILAIGIAAIAFARSKINPALRARNQVEKTMMAILIVCSVIAILTTVGIVMSLVFESWRFFEKVSPAEFLFGLEWSPQTALRSDQVGASGAFGAIPLFAGTMLISLVAMCVAGPVGLLSAIYMAEYAPTKVRGAVKPALEVLAGIPTVVYGFFAALTVAPFLRDQGTMFGLDISSESALAAGLVMGIMIIPFVSSLSDDVINAVPQSLREGSLGLGATKSETIKRVILPAALPGIVGSFMLAISRAIGETMIVVMAAGLGANLTANPLEAVTTVTVQIVTLLVGDQEFDSAKTLAAFALGLVLFCVTLCLNIIAMAVVNKYREQYD